MLFILTENGTPNGGTGIVKYLIKAADATQAWVKAKEQIPYLNNTARMELLEPFCHNEDVIKIFSWDDPHNEDMGG